jgi:hypothetical protein
MAATFSALFIDDQYLKDYTPLGKSVDINEIYPFVEEAQNVYIQDVLGTPLYIDLEYKLYTGVTYSNIERQLVDICSKGLAYWTVYMALPHLAIKIRNLGVARPTATDAQVSTIDEMKYVREEMKNLGEFWNTRVVNFLCENSTLFPLYQAASDDMYPNTRQYDSDIYLEETFRDLTLEEIRYLKKYLS